MTTIESIKAELEANLAKDFRPWHVRGDDVYEIGGRHICYVGPHHTPPHEYPESCRIVDRRNAAEIVRQHNEARLRARILLDVISRLEFYDPRGLPGQGILNIIACEWEESK